ncbi:MAG TPA: hypothetical protein VMN77_08930 [Nitrospiria bacterium]|nr:hypothetical protein [Nitrospiria bacterium]
MKRMLLGLVVGVVVLSFVSMSWAGMVTGELTKIDGSFYVVKDKEGKEHRIHFDNSTQKTGDIKAGANVEVDDANGHAKSIKAMEMKMDMKMDMKMEKK